MTDPTTDRPLVTFALFAYNQEKYIREAVEGAFSQTYKPLEIILSDDCSSDQTYQIMQEMAAAYEGPHEVRVRRGEKNLGVALHFDTLMREANGYLFLAAAGDDVSHANRTETCVLVSERHREIGLVEVGCKNFVGDYLPDNGICNNEDSDGPRHRVFRVHDVLEGKITGYVGAGRAYNRESYLKFPPLIEGCPAEDTAALFRCLYGTLGAVIEEKLVARRIHDSNLSSAASQSRMNFSKLKKQYFLDLEQAQALRLVNSFEYIQLHKLMTRYSFRKQCSIDVNQGFCGDIGLMDVLRSTHFSLREKIYLLRKSLQYKVRQHG